MKRVIAVNLFSGRCIHNEFLLDASLAHVTCAMCNEKLDPMWVIGGV